MSGSSKIEMESGVDEEEAWMKQTAIVNIYHFVRMSHVEPSRFIVDDFETIRNEIILTQQHGFPGTYSLKYEA